MTTSEVIKEVLSYGVLTAEEGISLLRYMEGCPDEHLSYFTSCKTLTPRNQKSEEREANRVKEREGTRRGGRGNAGVKVSGSGVVHCSRLRRPLASRYAGAVYGYERRNFFS